MRVVAFYTKDTGYEQEADIWVKSFESCDTSIYPVDSRGSWELNCGIKSEVLITALLESDEPILYVDIDARLCRPLEAIPNPELPGFCFLKQKTLCRTFNRQLASGTIYLPQTVNSFRILLAWNKLQKENPKTWDQITLQHVVESNIYGYQVLPSEWLGIAKKGRTEQEQQEHAGCIKHDAIIHHTQASRRFKKVINKAQISDVKIAHGFLIEYLTSAHSKIIESSEIDQQMQRINKIKNWKTDA